MRLELVSEVRQQVLQTSHSMYSHVANHTSHAVSEANDAARHAVVGGMLASNNNNGNGSGSGSIEGLLGGYGTSFLSIGLQLLLPYVSVDRLGRCVSWAVGRTSSSASLASLASASLPRDVFDLGDSDMSSIEGFSLSDSVLMMNGNATTGRSGNNGGNTTTSTTVHQAVNTRSALLTRFVARRFWAIVLSLDLLARYTSLQHPTVAHAMATHVGARAQRMARLSKRSLLALRVLRVFMEGALLAQLVLNVYARLRSAAMAGKDRCQVAWTALANATPGDQVAVATVAVGALATTCYAVAKRRTIARGAVAVPGAAWTAMAHTATRSRKAVAAIAPISRAAVRRVGALSFVPSRE
jgi:hypothetical protein